MTTTRRMGKIKPRVESSNRAVVDDAFHHRICRSSTALMDNSPLNNRRSLVRLLLVITALLTLVPTTYGSDIDLVHDKSRGLLRGGSENNSSPYYRHLDTSDIGQTAAIPPPISAGGEEEEEEGGGVHFVTNTTVILGGDTMKNPTVINDNDNDENMAPSEEEKDEDHLSSSTTTPVSTSNEIMDKEVSEAEEEADALLASVGMPTIPLPTYNNNENANKEGNNNNGSETVAEEIQDELTTVENEISSLVVAKNKIDTQLTNNVNGDSDGNGDDGEVIAKNIDNTIEDLEMVEEELIVEALEEGADDTISSSGGSDTASSAAAAASAPAGMMNTDDTITSTHSTTMVEDGEESGNGAHLYHTTTSDATEIREEEYVEKLKEYEEEVTEELVVKEKEEALGNNSDNSGTNKTNNNVTPMTGNENDDDGAGLGLTPATEEEEETSTPSPTVEYVEPSESLDPLKDENNIETYENGEVLSESQPMKHGNSNTESHEEKEDELSGETFKNTFPDWAEEEEVKKVGGWLTFAAIVLMIYTAYQMSENPDGICASLCRLVITVIGCVIKIMIIPFKYVLGRGSSSGGRYMTTPDYRDPFGSRQLELT